MHPAGPFSAGGGFAQLLALDFPERVVSLGLISSSPAVPVDRELPAPTEAFGRFVSSAQFDCRYVELSHDGAAPSC